MPGLKEEARFRWEEKRGWLLLPMIQQGSEAVGFSSSPSCLTVEGGSALWAIRSQAPGRLQKQDLGARINRDNTKPSTRSKEQGHQGRAWGPGPSIAWTNRLRFSCHNLHGSHDCVIQESRRAHTDMSRMQSI